jgi:drug/metabolite transporter (DMT)-like permease
MPARTIAIVLVAAVAHAIWNLASKYKHGDSLRFVSAYTKASALICLPIAAALTDSNTLRWQLVAASLGSAVLHLGYSLTLQAGYDRADLGVVYPVARGTGPLLTMLFAILLLAERLTIIALLGALVIVAGVVVVTGNPFHSPSGRPVSGLTWGVVTGASIAGYTLWDGYSVTSLHLTPMSYYTLTLLIQSVLLAPSALRRRTRTPTLRRNAIPIMIVAVLSPLAYVLVLTAMQTAPVALVAPLRESSIVIGSLAAWRLFHEDHLARRLAGASVVLAGIAAISLG